MQRRLTLVTSLCMACSFEGGANESNPANDAAAPDRSALTTDAANTDAALPLGDFSAPTKIPSISSIDGDDDPSVTADLLELFFSSDRNGNEDIFVVTRATVNDPWGQPTPVAELNTTSRDGEPQVHPNGLIMYLASSRPGGMGSFDVYRSSRPNRNAAWSTPVAVTDMNSGSDDLHACPDQDELFVVFNSTRNGNGYDLFMATRPDDITAWTVAAVDELNTDDNDSNTSMTPDALHVVLDSDRAGTMGDRDIWLASRPDTTSPFGTAVALTELNSAARDSDPWISADLRYIVFTSERDGIKEIYQASR